MDEHYAMSLIIIFKMRGRLSVLTAVLPERQRHVFAVILSCSVRVNAIER